MATKPVAIHAHTYSITTDTFKNSKGLSSQMSITQKDVWHNPDTNENIEFIDAMEGQRYPLFSTMYHPEY